MLGPQQEPGKLLTPPSPPPPWAAHSRSSPPQPKNHFIIYSNIQCVPKKRCYQKRSKRRKNRPRGPKQSKFVLIERPNMAKIVMFAPGGPKCPKTLAYQAIVPWKFQEQHFVWTACVYKEEQSRFYQFSIFTDPEFLVTQPLTFYFETLLMSS